MTTQPIDLHQLAQRLDRLEKQNEQLARHNRWLRGAAVAFVMAAGLAVLLHAAAPEGKADAKAPSVVNATALNIVDASGRVRLNLGIAADGTAGIAVTRQVGKDPGVLLVVDKDGNPRLTMNDGRGQRVRLGTDTDGFAFLNLCDRAGAAREVLSVTRDGTPVLHFLDTTGAFRQTLGIDADGQPHLTQFDRRKGPRARFYVDKDYSPNVVLFDSNKVRRAWLNVAPVVTEPALLGIYDGLGTLLWASK